MDLREKLVYVFFFRKIALFFKILHVARDSAKESRSPRQSMNELCRSVQSDEGI